MKVFSKIESLGLSTAAILIIAAATITQVKALSISTNPVIFVETSLDGTDQLINGSTTPWRVDASGETGGWNTTVSSTDFINAESKTISVSNFQIRLLDANIIWVSGDVTGPASSQTSFTSLSSTPVKIASSAAGAGNGIYDLTPEFQLAIPAETYAGSYSATMTIQIGTGP